MLAMPRRFVVDGLLAAGLVGGGLVVAASTASSAPAPAMVGSVGAGSSTVQRVEQLRHPGYERRVVVRTNRARARHDLSPLYQRRCVDRFANRWARHLAHTQTLVHQDLAPILSTCGLGRVGENIAYGYQSPKAVVAAWMHSAGHRANILEHRYQLIGVGAATDDDGTYWVSQVFGRRR